MSGSGARPSAPGGFSFMDAAIQVDPYPAYAWLRRNAPVYKLRDSPMWVVSRHEDVERVLRDHATFSSDLGMSVPIMSMVMRDPPDHTRLRQTVNRAFTPRAIQRLAPRIREVAEELLGEAMPAADIVRDFAVPLSVTVICGMLGVPIERRDEMNRHARDALVAAFAATGMGSPELLAEARVGLEALMGILDEAIARHAALPSDNIISGLIEAEAQGVLSRAELRNLCALLLIGGHETTANLIANGAYILAETPTLWARLRREPEAIAAFVEEMARLRPPLQRIARRTTREVRLADTTLPSGAVLTVFPGSANRDAVRWSDADALDLGRDARGHLGFGVGIHACPGAPLARMEARIAFEALLKRAEDIRLDPAQRPVPTVGYGAGNLGWNALPMLLVPARTQDAFSSPPPG